MKVYGQLERAQAENLSASPTVGVVGRLWFNTVSGALCYEDGTNVRTLVYNALASANILVGNGSGVATAVAVTGDVTISNAGVTAIGASKVTSTMLAGSIAYAKLTLTGSIVNADVASAAAVAGTKISPDFGSQNVLTTGTGTFSSLSQTGNTLTIDSDSTGAQLTIIKTGANTNQLYITAQTSVGTAGGEISLYGGSHATDANRIKFAIAGAFSHTFDENGNYYNLTGNIGTSTAGKGFSVKEGTNAKMGVTSLVAGTKVVSTTAVTANSRIFCFGQLDGGTPAFIRITGRTAGTSFTIASASGADTSTVAWILFEPTP
jgi:hypothetical protein